MYTFCYTIHIHIQYTYIYKHTLDRTGKKQFQHTKFQTFTAGIPQNRTPSEFSKPKIKFKLSVLVYPSLFLKFAIFQIIGNDDALDENYSSHHAQNNVNSITDSHYFLTTKTIVTNSNNLSFLNWPSFSPKNPKFHAKAESRTSKIVDKCFLCMVKFRY